MQDILCVCVNKKADAAGSNWSRGKACSKQELLLLHQSNWRPVSARKILWQILRLQFRAAGKSVCLWRKARKGKLHIVKLFLCQQDIYLPIINTADVDLGELQPSHACAINIRMDKL